MSVKRIKTKDGTLHQIDYNSLENLPNLSNYITNTQLSAAGYLTSDRASNLYASITHSHSYSDIAGTPDVYTKAQVDALIDSVSSNTSGGTVDLTGYYTKTEADTRYALKGHEHSGYALSSHNHDSAYASKTHDHAEYAASDHTHTGYASSTHTHTAGSIGAAASNHSHSEYLTTSSASSTYATKSAVSTVTSDVSNLEQRVDTLEEAGYVTADHTHDGYVSSTRIDSTSTFSASTANNIPTKGAVGTYTSTNYAVKDHNHNTLYYTKSEIDALVIGGEVDLSGYAKMGTSNTGDFHTTGSVAAKELTADALYIGPDDDLAVDGTAFTYKNNDVLHAGNFNTYAAAKSHTHNYTDENYVDQAVSDLGTWVEEELEDLVTQTQLTNSINTALSSLTASDIYYEDNMGYGTDSVQDTLDLIFNHNHDGVYSKVDHNHDGTYSKANHNHDETYSKTNHNHDGTYSKTDHTHNYAGSSSAGGVATSAAKITTSNSAKPYLTGDDILNMGSTIGDVENSVDNLLDGTVRVARADSATNAGYATNIGSSDASYTYSDISSKFTTLSNLSSTVSSLEQRVNDTLVESISVVASLDSGTKVADVYEGNIVVDTIYTPTVSVTSNYTGATSTDRKIATVNIGGEITTLYAPTYAADIMTSGDASVQEAIEYFSVTLDELPSTYASKSHTHDIEEIEDQQGHKLYNILADNYAAIDHSHNTATSSTAGLMSAADKVKLDATNNYVLPKATSAVLGGIKIGSGLSVADTGVVSVNYASNASPGIVNLETSTQGFDQPSGEYVPTTAVVEEWVSDNFSRVNHTHDYASSSHTHDNYITTTAAEGRYVKQSSVVSTISETTTGTYIPDMQAVKNYVDAVNADTVTRTGAQIISGVKTFSSQQKFTAATGTSPFTVSSTTVVSNLNADKLDGQDGSYYSGLVQDLDKYCADTYYTIASYNSNNAALQQNIANNYATINHTHTNATIAAAGLMSAADKSKLDNIDSKANNYVLLAATSDTLGGVKVGDGLTVASDGKLSVNHASNASSGIVKLDTSTQGFDQPSGEYVPTTAVVAEYLEDNYAAANHTHSNYATSGHTHSAYATTSHNHDGTYAPLSHTHNYADASHTHSSYATKTYVDDSVNDLGTYVEENFTLRGHTHSTYAPKSHTHALTEIEDQAGYTLDEILTDYYATISYVDESFAPAVHTHSGYVDTSSAQGIYGYKTFNDSVTFSSTSTVNLNGSVYVGGKTLSTYIKDTMACLMEGTLITMADESLKPIEEVKAGDLLKSIDIETGNITTAVCLDNDIGDIKPYHYCLVFDNGARVRTNWTHDIYNATKGTWTNTDRELVFGDEVLTESGDKAKFLYRFEAVGNPGGMRKRFYDIVSSNNCYYADGILFAHTPTKQATLLDNKDIKLPQDLKDLILSYKNEMHRESDLLLNDEFISKYSEHVYKIEDLKVRMEELKSKLSNSDHVAIRLAEGEDLDEDMSNILISRKQWRKEYDKYQDTLNEACVEANKLVVEYSVLGEDVLLPAIELRKKFFLESCSLGNKNLDRFKEFYGK